MSQGIDSLRDYVVFNRVTRVACARYVSGCSAKEDPAVDASALWKISVDIGALSLLSIGDFFVEVKKPSEKATETLYQTLSLSAKAIESLVKGDMMWPDGKVKLLSDQVLDSVDVAEACGGHVNLEPRFTDAPWKMVLFTQAITQTRKIGSCWTFSTTTECLADRSWIVHC